MKNPTDKQPPFIKLESQGACRWEMSPQLTEVYARLENEVGGFREIADDELQSGFIALEMMVHRIRRMAREGVEVAELWNLEAVADEFTDHPLGPEEAVMMFRFVASFANRLIPPSNDSDTAGNGSERPLLPGSRRSAERLKKETLKWTSDVIDRRFSNWIIKPENRIRRAYEAIPLALALCREIDALPSKELLAKHLGKLDEKKWTLGTNETSTLWKLSGLNGLPPGPKRGKAKNGKGGGKFAGVAGVSYP